MFGPCIALAERSLLAITRGAWDLGANGTCLRPGPWPVRPSWRTITPVAIMHAARLRGWRVREGGRPRAEAALTRAQRLRPGLTYALPHLAVQARSRAGEVLPRLVRFRRGADPCSGRPTRSSCGAPASASQSGRPRTCGRSFPAARGSSALGASALTTAELRLLPMLSASPPVAPGDAPRRCSCPATPSRRRRYRSTGS